MGFRPTLVGTPGDDRIRATYRDDVIMTLGGNDVIVGPQGGEWRDYFCTGPGEDQVVYRGGFDLGLESHIDLGPGDDRMTVTGFAPWIIYAGPGDDTILFGRRSWTDVVPGPGDDVIRGPALRGIYRTTCIDLRTARGPVRIDLARGRATGQGRDRFPPNTRCAVGGRFNDVLLGTPRDDELDGGGGLDLVRAGAGNDRVLGGLSKAQSALHGDRADVLYLGPGDDTGDGGPGRDRLYGGPGSDEIDGDTGGDYLDGGPGDDYLYSGRGCSGMFESEPGANEEMMTGSAGNEVFGGTGDDFLAGDRGNDRLDGGPGFDSGTGGYYDGRIDWITSVERPDNCNSRY